MAVRHRFKVEEVLALSALEPEARLELLEGEVYEMAPISNEHAGLLDWLLQTLATRTLGQAHIRVQSPLYLSQESLPIPDLLLLKPREDFYTQSHPTPQEVLLLVEVGFSSYAYDRGVKLPLYARHGVPEVWLWGQEGLEVYREPQETAYRHRLLGKKGERIAPLLLPQAEILWSPPL
ncbi:Uma2 family endonuclease [Thermus caliditerrae]|uniref:Uma2 family endonuclease n=1 Tax=Thermus caliditerrae TaxID=1330700 RepID=UPI001F3E3251|nr:Uma2 family endonuclease [Thermus caliditerrae]